MVISENYLNLSLTYFCLDPRKKRIFFSTRIVKQAADLLS